MHPIKPLRQRPRPGAFVTLALAALTTALTLAGASCGGGDADSDEAPDALGAGLDAPDALADDAVPPPLEVPADAPTVLFLCDSIGAGLHLAEHQAFPAVLQRRLTADGQPFHLINASVSGRTTSGGVDALDWTLAREPDVVVLGFGGNDGLRGVPLTEVERNLRTMIARSAEVADTVILLGVRIPANYGEYAEELAALYPELAAETGVTLVPFFMEGVGLVPELNLADGMHPSPEGHERIADTVAPALAAALRALPAE